VRTGSHRSPLLGFVGTNAHAIRPPYRPFTDMASTRPLPPDVAIGLRIRAASSDSCSVLVVSHHRDGFLRVETCGLVASRYRSWGSPRFLRSIATCCRSCRGRAARSPRCFHPSKNSRDRSCSASPRPLPPRRSAPFGAVDLEVLFHDRVCDVASPLQMTRTLSFLGFSFLFKVLVAPSLLAPCPSGDGSVAGRDPSVGSSAGGGEPCLSMLSESVRRWSSRTVVGALGLVGRSRTFLRFLTSKSAPRSAPLGGHRSFATPGL
jgi:hypothetical protein